MAVDLKTRLFAKLAIQSNFITEEQFRECLRLQADAKASGKPAKLTDILMQRGYLKAGQIQAILRHMKQGVAEQRRSSRIAKVPAGLAAPRKRPRFGELAVAFGMLTIPQVKEGLDLQKLAVAQRPQDARPKLGEIAQKKGWMMAHQVRAVLAEQNKRLADCPVCNASNTISDAKPGARVRCAACYAVLLVTPRGDELMVDPSSTLAADPSKTRINQRIGNYIIESRLGSDAVGKTYKGIDLGDHTKSAVLKVFSKSAVSADDEADLVARIREAAKIKHDNLRRMLSMGHIDKRLFVVMEYMEGHSLWRILREARTLPVPKVLALGIQAGQALQAIHEASLVHGDLRPSNLLMTPGGQIRVGGLGLNLRTTDNILSIAESGESAPFYVAPEQVVDEGGADARSDIYSLGACMYHALTGRPPFEGSSPFEILVRFTEDPLTPIRELQPKVPLPIALAVEKMLAPEPDDRYQTAEQMIRSLKRPRKPRGDKAKAAAKGLRPVSAAAPLAAPAAAISADDLDADVSDEYDPGVLLASSEDIVPATISTALGRFDLPEADLPLYYQRRILRSQPKKRGWLVATLVVTIAVSAIAIAGAFLSKGGPAPTEVGAEFDRINATWPGTTVADINQRIAALNELLADKSLGGEDDETRRKRARVNTRLRAEQSSLNDVENRARTEVQRIRTEVARHVLVDEVPVPRTPRCRFSTALRVLDEALAADGAFNRAYAGTQAHADAGFGALRERVLQRANQFAAAVGDEASRVLEAALRNASGAANPDAVLRTQLERELDAALVSADALWVRITDHFTHADLAAQIAKVDAARESARARINEQRTRLGLAVISAAEEQARTNVSAFGERAQSVIEELRAASKLAQSDLAALKYGDAQDGLQRARDAATRDLDRALARRPALDALPPALAAGWTQKLDEHESQARATMTDELAQVATLLDDIRCEARMLAVTSAFNADATSRLKLGDAGPWPLQKNDTTARFVRFATGGVEVRVTGSGSTSPTVLVPWDCRGDAPGGFAPETMGRLLLEMATIHVHRGGDATALGQDVLGVALYLRRIGAVQSAARVLRLVNVDAGARGVAIIVAYEAQARRATEAFLARVKDGVRGRDAWRQLDADGLALMADLRDSIVVAEASEDLRKAFRQCFLGASGAPPPRGRHRVFMWDSETQDPPVPLDDHARVVGPGESVTFGADVNALMLRLRFVIRPDDRDRFDATIELPGTSGSVHIGYTARSNRSVLRLDHPSTVRTFTPDLDYVAIGWHELAVRIDGRGRVRLGADYADNPEAGTDPAATSLGVPTIRVEHGQLLLDMVHILVPAN